MLCCLSWGEGSLDLALSARSPSRYDNRITLQKLEVFCAVVELGVVSRAADHLWVAQSVVSGHLRSLQERLGVQVFYRDGQRMKLTKAGEQVNAWAKETLSGTRKLDNLDQVGGSILALAASLAVGSYLLPPILAEFRRERPPREFRDGTLREIPIVDADLWLPVLSIARADQPSSAIQAELIDQTRTRPARR